MPWAKVDDGWWSHPKVLDLPLEARGLWVSALSWSCAQRRDVVPVTFARMLAGSKAEALAGELVKAGLWVDVDEGWRIHDWAEYQEKTLSEKRAESGRKGGVASGKSRAKTKQPMKQKESKPDLVQEANDEAGTQPGPTRPNRSQPESEEGFATSEISPRGQSSSPASPAEQNGRNPYYDAAMRALDMPQSGSHEGTLGSIAAKAKNGGHDPDEILRRAALHLATFNWALTPGSLNKRWDELGSKVVTATEGERKQISRQMDRMRRRELITGGSQ